MEGSTCDFKRLLDDSNIGCGRSKPSRRCGIDFVSLSEQMDTSTPTGKMVFTVLGAVAELERSLIAERVRAGLRNARAKGKRLGRPPVRVNAGRVMALRRSGASWAKIAARLGIGRATAQRAFHDIATRTEAQVEDLGQLHSRTSRTHMVDTHPLRPRCLR